MKYLDKDGLLYFWTLIKGKFVAQEQGKGLSTNDYTTAEKTKLGNVASGAQVNVIEDVKVNSVSQTITNKSVNITMPTNVSDLTNDSGFTKVEKSDTNGNIKVDGTEITVYTHPTTTAVSAAFVKVGKDASGHAVIGSAVGKSDITTALGYTPLTESEIATKIANAGHLKRTIVTTLPDAASADANTIYMVKQASSISDDNKYDEYMVIDGAWERVGGSDVDLTPYVKSADLVAITNTEIDGVVAS